MSEQSTFQYFINKRIDKLEENMCQRIDSRFDGLEKVINAHIAYCLDTHSKFNIRVANLEAFRNKVIGIAIVVTALMGLVKLT